MSFWMNIGKETGIKKSKKIIEIVENKLQLNNIFLDLDDQIMIYSIIGTARTGKSTFLNCMTSYLIEKNFNIFDIDNTDEHCTTGIDIFYCKNKNIILLDCQGLKLYDSSNDPKLLLIIYLMSDCIIYNQKSILNNDVLETLQPLTNFINYIENIKHKPILMFRLVDCELIFDSNELLKKFLMKKKRSISICKRSNYKYFFKIRYL